MMRLSVIVPVFNAEAYLPRCLDSLLKQGMKAEEWEVICVDDGSTDRSPRILAEYAHLHPKVFRVVRQERRGPGIARNSGLDVAQGEYVTFADADDYVLAGGYRYLYDHYCAGRQPDVLAFASVTLNNYQLKHWNYSDKPQGGIVYEGEGTENFNRKGLPFVWDKFYRLNFLRKHSIRFAERYICEDALFNFHVFIHKPYMIETDTNIYRYTKENELSVISRRDKPYLKKMLDDIILNVLNMNQYHTEEYQQMASGIKRFIGMQMSVWHTRSAAAHLTYKEWAAYAARLATIPFHQVAMPPRWKAVGWLMNRSFDSYLAYTCLCFLYNCIFEPFIHKRLS